MPNKKVYIDGVLVSNDDYKIYTAFLSQSSSQTSGLLIIGRKYTIDAVLGSDDFSNVGFISTGIEFIATGTTPINWTDNSLVIPTPIVNKILQNTIGDIVWTRQGIGKYIGTLAGAFTYRVE